MIYAKYLLFSITRLLIVRLKLIHNLCYELHGSHLGNTGIKYYLFQN
jgi:hypothetical protein